MVEKIKDILKPIRREAQVCTGTTKKIFEDILREIEHNCGKDATRQDILDELERQHRETEERLEGYKRMIMKLDKGDGYIHWEDEECDEK